MNTRKRKPGLLRFVVLVPHRDSQGLLEDYRQTLFAGGFKGAYSFPVCAPLALVARSLSGEELKALALEAREVSRERDGKITAGTLALVSCPFEEEGMELGFFGPLLDLPPPESLGGLKHNEVLFRFPQTLLSAALADAGQEARAPEFVPFGFRAARIANLAIRPCKSGAAPFSWEWRLDRGCWLPAYKRGKGS